MPGTGDYEVGYRKPPLHTRFKKGVSGNPGGRPGAKKLAFGRFLLAIDWALEQAPETVAALKTSDPIRRLAYDTVLAMVDGDDRARRQLFSVMGIDNLKAARRTRAALRVENGVPAVCRKKRAEALSCPPAAPGEIAD
ncbi:MAG TPA: DUF5681 domain-containing protein [Rhizomicrobium sp.]|nr:DUF5681 domain-containing protein [Rhizomicrobium sp.]